MVPAKGSREQVLTILEKEAGLKMEKSRKSHAYEKGHPLREWPQSLELVGRDGVIRTLDPLHPMQVRYRAALRPDMFSIPLRTERNVT